MKRLFIFIVLFILAKPLWALEGFVLNLDNDGRSSLEHLLEYLCHQPGDDWIHFPHTTYDRLVIPVRRTLVIPEACDGSITLVGSTEVETILDGRNIREGQPTFRVGSSGNHISGFTFVRNQQGVGLVVEGSNNVIEDSFFGVAPLSVDFSPNHTGIVISGSGNTFRNNTILSNLEDGVVIRGDGNTLQANVISANHRNGITMGGNQNSIRGNRIGDYHCSRVLTPDENSFDLPIFMHEINYDPFAAMLSPVILHLAKAAECGNGGAGVQIHGNQNRIGWGPFEDGNRILFNQGGGIVIGSHAQQNQYSRNVIAYNQGEGVHLDSGANEGIEPIQHWEAFPIQVELAPYRYTLTGEGESGTTVDLYLVALDEQDTSQGYGQGAKYLESFTLNGGQFLQTLERNDIPPGSRLSSVVCDPRGNCSSFSQNLLLDRDSDHDGLVDSKEDKNGNGIVDPGETDPLNADTDGDGLPDGIEDKNHNWLIDPGETDSTQVDTDRDGLSDFIETGGDGIYNPELGDTDPLNSDTDGDGILDGQEDRNHNGRIDIDETDPRNPNTYGYGLGGG